MSTACNIYNGMIVLLAWLAGLILAGMSLWTTYEVVARYVFLQPTIWAADLSEYGLLWATFLAAPWVLRKGGHVRVEVLIDMLGPRWQRRIGLTVSIIAAVACGILAWRSGLTAYGYFEKGQMIARIWQIPRFLPYLAIPVGSALLSTEFLLRAADYHRSQDPEARLRGRRTVARH